MLPRLCLLFLTEGQAIGTLIHCRIALVGAYQNPIQRTVIGIIAMMDALSNSAFNALVCMRIHRHILLSVLIGIVFPVFFVPFIKNSRAAMDSAVLM